MSRLQETHIAELQRKDAQHTRAMQQLRQREGEFREEIQQKNEDLQQKNSDISRLQREIERLQVCIRKEQVWKSKIMEHFLSHTVVFSNNYTPSSHTHQTYRKYGNFHCKNIFIVDTNNVN